MFFFMFTEEGCEMNRVLHESIFEVVSLESMGQK
jgi:hypothetical protein